MGWLKKARKKIKKTVRKATPFALGGLTGGGLYNYIKKSFFGKDNLPTMGTIDPSQIFLSALGKRAQRRQQFAGMQGRSSTTIPGLGNTLLG